MKYSAKWWGLFLTGIFLTLFNNCGQGFKALDMNVISSTGQPTSTPTPNPTSTPTATTTPRPSPTLTPPPSQTPTPTPTGTVRPSPTPSSTPTPTPSPVLRTATLSWSAPTLNEDGTPGTARGYKIYYGTSSGNYTTTVSEATIGNNTSYVVTGLQSGRTYYFAIVSIDAAGEDSRMTNELPYLVP